MAMQFYYADVFFHGRTIKNIAETLTDLGFFVSTDSLSGEVMTATDETAPMGMTVRPLNFFCYADPSGTWVQHIVGTERERDRSRAFLRALADGRAAEVRELLGAMRLTPHTP